jgi:Carbohydrate family 9 binding domain-like
VPRATSKLAIDGQVSPDEYAAALCTPVEYFHWDAANRAGQFFYLWDDEAFYVGLRTLDGRRYSPESPLWEGDAVEWYFDCRRGDDFLSRSWPKEANPGAVHCFFTAMRLDKLEPRFTLRPGYESAIPKQGVKVAAQQTPSGLEVEFKLPWANFPAFKPRVGEVIGIDAELSYSDGGPRSDRSFVFGSPLSVQMPANLARVQLVEQLEPSHWQAAGAVIMPMRVDAPWSQEGAPQCVGRIAMPPAGRDQLGRIVFQVNDLHGKLIGEFAADNTVILGNDERFELREARWPTAVAPPGRCQVHAVVYDRDGKELTRVAPRLVSVNMEPGY